MKPQVKRVPSTPVGHMWQVLWPVNPGSTARVMIAHERHFYTFAAALDFANERAAEARRVNHLHLWEAAA